jgi:photosystem II stability/assembly factor-like uncharacterized protein
MRKFKALIFAVILILAIQSVSFSQSVWNTRQFQTIEGNQLRKVQFVNAAVGYTGGGNGKFVKTTNSGDSWNVLNIGLTGYITAIYFIDENTGWVGSTEHLVKKTTDGGVTWASQPLSTSSYIADIYFNNSQTGYLSGNAGQIFKTSNGGTNWTNIAPINTHWGEVKFIDINTGWILSDYDLYRTTNAGTTWTSIFHNAGMQLGYFQDFHFINSLTGWATIPSGIAKTTNGGDTWSFKTIQMANPMAVQFLNENVGWCAGHTNNSTGYILGTVNGGTNWVTQKIEQNNEYWDISFANINMGWATGDAIVSSTTTGGLVSVIQTSTQSPDAFSLKQNFPNPFNPTTKISFAVKNSTFASLKIFDMNGKEVKTLVDGNISAGTYEINFNASELNSGVYFYTLKTNEFTETKKMTLIK